MFFGTYTLCRDTRGRGAGAEPSALPIDAYLDMSEDILDLQGQLEAKMLERERKQKVCGCAGCSCQSGEGQACIHLLLLRGMQGLMLELCALRVSPNSASPLTPFPSLNQFSRQWTLGRMKWT